MSVHPENANAISSVAHVKPPPGLQPSIVSLVFQRLKAGIELVSARVRGDGERCKLQLHPRAIP